MPKDQLSEVSREAVGIFHTPETLQDAIDELLSSGFNRAELGLLASETTIREKLGHRHATVAALADDPATPRMAYFGDEDVGNAEGGIVGGLVYVGATLAAGAVVASGGTLLAALAGAAVIGGAGGMIGSVLAQWIGDSHARHLQEHLEKGGLLLWVRTRDAEMEQRAVRILARHAADKVHVHSLPLTKRAA